ncbi:MFS transporter [Thermodesulfobacteriota bacterium]
MDNGIKSSKVFFGWWIVLVTGIVSGLGHGFYQYGLSVFFKDLAAELGLSRAVTSVAAGIGRFEGGITSPIVGWFSDRYGPRWIIFTGVCVAASGMVMMSFITTVWAYFIVWGVIIGVGLNIGLTVAVDKTLNDWFVNKRGVALGIKFSLIGVGGVLSLPIVTWLVMTYGWRVSCLVWGCVMFVCAPITMIFVRQKRPEYYGFLPDGAAVGPGYDSETDDMVNRGVEYASGFQETEFTFKQAIKTRAYWILVVSFGAQAIIVGGLTIHIIPFLTDMGIDRTVASSMMGMMLLSMIPSTFLGGVVVDRIGKDNLKFILVGGFLLQAVGITAFLISGNTASLYLFLILYGFCGGASTPIFITIIGRFFGRKAFGSIFGCSIAIRTPISLMAPVFSGWIYDTSGSYIVAFIIYAALAVFASLLMCLLKSEVLPVMIPDSTENKEADPY